MTPLQLFREVSVRPSNLRLCVQVVAASAATSFVAVIAMALAVR